MHYKYGYVKLQPTCVQGSLILIDIQCIIQVISLCYTLIVVRLMKTNVTDGGRRSSNTESTRSGGKDSTKKIWRTNRRKSSSASTGRTYREKVRVTVMCAVLVLLFILCWLPFHSVHLAKIEGITIQDVSFAFVCSHQCYISCTFAQVCAMNVQQLPVYWSWQVEGLYRLPEVQS